MCIVNQCTIAMYLNPCSATIKCDENEKIMRTILKEVKGFNPTFDGVDIRGELSTSCIYYMYSCIFNNLSQVPGFTFWVVHLEHLSNLDITTFILEAAYRLYKSSVRKKPLEDLGRLNQRRFPGDVMSELQE